MRNHYHKEFDSQDMDLYNEYYRMIEKQNRLIEAQEWMPTHEPITDYSKKHGE